MGEYKIIFPKPTITTEASRIYHCDKLDAMIKEIQEEQRRVNDLILHKE